MTPLKPERRLLLLALAGGAPALAGFVVLLAGSDLGPGARWSLALAAAGFWLGGAAVLRRAAAFRLRTASNLLAAVREGDYSFRARGGRRDDAFGELIAELNLLAETLRGQRLDDVESTALLRKVMSEIDVAFFAFDPAGRLRLVNRHGEHILGRSGEELVGREAAEVGLGACLEGPPARTLMLQLATGGGRWEVRRGVFRQQGRPLTLLVLFDVSRALRAEELAAWRRLIRVIGHELNNSLAPIKSIAGSLERLAGADPLPADWRDDLASGLGVIASRADALNRFMSAYAMLAKMPPPRPRPVRIADVVRRAASLETRVSVGVQAGPDTVIDADPDQLEQALINLVKNAADACAAAGGAVCVGWRVVDGMAELWVRDDGPGLPDSANLFVPFFTTKPGGSGIGLVLCRQIAEAHGGSFALADRGDVPGCRAVIRLPAAATAAVPR